MVVESSSSDGRSSRGIDTKSTVRDELSTGNGFGARCSNRGRTFRTAATVMLSESVPDGDGEGAFRLAIMARDLTAKQNKRFTAKSRCMKCVVMFAVDLSQGP
jgi:hypothetical protein